jgi:hypothetical protein
MLDVTFTIGRTYFTSQDFDLRYQILQVCGTFCYPDCVCLNEERSMLSDSVEFLLDDGNANLDGYNNFFSGMNHKSAVRFHSNLSHGLMRSLRSAAVKYSEMNSGANRPFWNPLLGPRGMKATVTDTIAIGNRIWLRKNVVTCSFLPFCYGIFCFSTRGSGFVPTRWFDEVWSPHRPSSLQLRPGWSKLVGDSEPLQ